MGEVESRDDGLILGLIVGGLEPKSECILACAALASSDILLGLQWYELESKGGAFGLRLLKPGLVSPSLDTSPLLLSELGYNCRQDVVLDLYL